ncbi:hypothetical protein [Leisingera caerulea]|uniref:hypothetical protein n=1 Tax=Leisingera caerulea TaxID=506591 RepID=UPI003F4AE6FC
MRRFIYLGVGWAAWQLEHLTALKGWWLLPAAVLGITAWAAVIFQVLRLIIG